MSNSLKFRELTLRLDNVMLEIERQKRRACHFEKMGEAYDSELAQAKIEGLQKRAETISKKIKEL